LETKKKIKILGLYFLFSLLFILSEDINCQPIEFGEWELVVDAQNFPEGIVWSTDEILYSSNCNGGWITRITDEKIDTFLVASDSTFGKTNGMIAYENGLILACDYGNGEILKFDRNGKREILIDGYNGVKLNRPNDLTLDKYGNLFFTDPKSHGKDILDGRVFYFNFAKNELKLIIDSMAFPNGIGISPVTNKLYVCESAKSRILSFDLDNELNITNKRVFVELPGGDPDGFNFDVNGNMYVAHFGSGTLFIISPEGKILHSIKTPGNKPSNVEFGGNDKKTLYLTEDETNSIYKMRVSIRGFSL
jgi:gluconolactonase